MSVPLLSSESFVDVKNGRLQSGIRKDSAGVGTEFLRRVEVEE
jgi:hypothetical protein